MIVQSRAARLSSRPVLVAALVATLVVSMCGGARPSPKADAPTAEATPIDVAKPAPSSAARPLATASPTASSAAGAVEISGPFEGEAQQLTGAGATFPEVLYSRWFSDYERLTGVQVNYQGIGSGGGIRGITDQTVDFGATDAPMTDEQLHEAGEVLHIPTALGAIVATYNLPGLGEPLKFTPENLAAIFLGDILNWNDPRLAADNPGLLPPDLPIVVIHRSDGSGATAIWTAYLSAVSPTWQDSVGSGTSVDWPTGLGARGNPGVTNEIKLNEGAIGYVELVYARQHDLGVGQIRNRAGQFVGPRLESVTAAAAAIADTIAPDLRASLVDAPGRNAYPISGFTWLLVAQNQGDGPMAIALTRLLWWATHEGQRLNSELGYAPLPEEIVRRAEEKIRSITVDGQPAFPGR